MMDKNPHLSYSISRRNFLRIAGLSAAGVIFSACGSRAEELFRGEPTPPSDEPVNLVYQDWRTDWFPALAQEQLAIFHDLHPNIRVFYTPDPDNLEEKMLQEMEAGTAPDVFAGCCAFFPAWAHQGYTLDLHPMVEKDLTPEMISDWSEAQYKAFFTANGEQFALPKYHGGLALYYSKDAFDDAGISYPGEDWTFDQYLDAMQQLTIQSGGSTSRWGSMIDPSWDRIQIHVNSWGGHFVNPDDPAQCEMASQPSLDAHEWLRKRMWEDKVMATALDVENLETRQAFMSEKIAMVEDGSWALKDILANAQFRVGVAPFPAGPVQHATLATTDGFAIYKRTRHPAEAWELMKFLVSEDYGRAMAKAHFLQPARKSLVPDWVQYIQEEFPEKAIDVDIAAFADGHIKGYSVTAEVFRNMVGVVDIARETWESMLTLGQSPVSILNDVCQKIEAIQKETKSSHRLGAGFSTSDDASCDCEG
jgi:multiple sugar transport system substrate-binding protein